MTTTAKTVDEWIFYYWRQQSMRWHSFFLSFFLSAAGVASWVSTWLPPFEFMRITWTRNLKRSQQQQQQHQVTIDQTQQKNFVKGPHPQWCCTTRHERCLNYISSRWDWWKKLDSEQQQHTNREGEGDCSERNALPYIEVVLEPLHARIDRSVPQKTTHSISDDE